MLNTEPSNFKILIVDDETGVRRVMMKALAREGYQVTGVATSHEAFAHIETDGPFHLLLMDINLDGCDGRTLAQELKVRCPGLAVIFCSGDHREGADVLLKPFSIAVLRDRVQAELACISWEKP